MQTSQHRRNKAWPRLLASAILLCALPACATKTHSITKSAFRTADTLQSGTAADGEGRTQDGPPTSLAGQKDADPLAARKTERIIGSGKFFSSRQPGSEPSFEGGGDAVLNFVDSDIRKVAQAVFEDMLSVNYVIEPGVTGNVSLVTSKPVRTEQILPLVESVFHLNGVAIVYKDGLYHVVRESEALRIGAPVSFGGDNRDVPGFSVRVLPLKFADADQIRALIEPITPKETIVSIDKTRNLIIVAGDSATLSRLTATIASFDVDWMAGMSFSLVPVNSPDPADLVHNIEKVFSLDGEADDKTLRFLPLERLGAVLVTSRNPQTIKRAEEWVERLDRAPTLSGRQLFVYDVQYGRAPELASLLSSIFNAASGGAGGGARSVTAPGEEIATLAPDGVENFGDGSSFDGGDFSAAPSGGGALDGLRIFPYDTSNSLAVFATPGEYKAVEKALKRLDVRPLQVMLEATIADVTLNDDLRFGVQWFLEEGKATFGFTESSSALGPVGATVPGFAFLFQNNDASVALSALESVTDVQILSRPRLLVSNNEQAVLQVGDQVPIVTRTATSTINPDAPLVSNVELRDTGVILTVTPRINANRLVSLEIEQEVSDVVSTTTSGIDSPTIRQRLLNTKVSVDSGSTIALGGLIREDTTITRSGLPVLSDIPLFGSLFGNRKTINRRGELIVLITPRVVQQPADLEAITQELVNQISILEM